MIVNAYLFNRHFIGHHQTTAGLEYCFIGQYLRLLSQSVYHLTRKTYSMSFVFYCEISRFTRWSNYKRIMQIIYNRLYLVNNNGHTKPFYISFPINY